MSKKTGIIIAAALASAVILIIAAARCSKQTDISGENGTPVQTSEAQNTAENASDEEEAVYTPTFMYFISASDPDFDVTNAMIEDLKKEYDGRVNFDVVNIDDAPEAKENFPVDQQTPALIMLNTQNNISAIEFKCSDKQLLRQYIEAALK